MHNLYAKHQTGIFLYLSWALVIDSGMSFVFNTALYCSVDLRDFNGDPCKSWFIKKTKQGILRIVKDGRDVSPMFFHSS